MDRIQRDFRDRLPGTGHFIGRLVFVGEKIGPARVEMGRTPEHSGRRSHRGGNLAGGFPSLDLDDPTVHDVVVAGDSCLDGDRRRFRMLREGWRSMALAQRCLGVAGL